jgi:superfamily II DNA or RNA helicase
MQTLLRWNHQIAAPLTRPIYNLRDYQGKAIAQVEAHHANGRNRVFVCAPTGSGKGTMIGALTQRAVLRREKVLILLNMSPLVGQSIEDLQDFGLDGNISVISGSHDRAWFQPNLPIQVAMLQTLANRPEELEYLSQADLVVFDEFHTTRNYESAIDFLCGKTKVVSFSATPYNSPLGAVVDDAVICPSYLELQAQGFLSPLKYTVLELDRPGKRDMNSDEGVEYILSQFLRTEGVQKEGVSRSLWFCEANRSGAESHCRRLQRIAQKYGLNLVVVDESMSVSDREMAIAACDSQEIDGLICVDSLAVGVDIKSIRHVNILRKVGSRDRFVQIVGRGSRVSESTGKTCAYINDWGGNLKVGNNGGQHPFIEVLSSEITREQILGLPSEKEGEAPVKWCSSCGIPHHVGAIVCSVCNTPFPAKDLVSLSSGRVLSCTLENWWEPKNEKPWWD